MNPDLDLIDRVMDHIDTHPEEWDQTTWSCSTAFGGIAACFGVRAALIDGWQVVDSWGGMVEEGTGGPERHASDVAVGLLGIDFHVALRLFAATNTLDDLHSMVKQIHGAPYQPLSWEQDEECAS